ncbi:MAG: hypothetical protein ACFE0I_22360 [Elainellaceae cyanobacterium]
MKAMIALLTSVLGLTLSATGALAQEAGSRVAFSEPEPIPEGFSNVSVDSRDLETEPISIADSELFETPDTFSVAEFGVFQVNPRNFPSLDEIYRDPGPARANWFRILLEDGRRTDAQTDESAGE